MQTTSIHRPRHAGLGMIEMLIALAICAMLLTSVALAFHASLTTVEENQKISTITQSARIILHRMMAQARQADDVDFVGASQVGSIQYGPDTNLRFVESLHLGVAPPLEPGEPTDLEYEFLNGSLWYRQTLSGVQESYELIGPSDGLTITHFQILACQVDEDKDGTWDYTRDITAEMTLQIDGNTFAVTASTNPRRNLAW